MAEEDKSLVRRPSISLPHRRGVIKPLQIALILVTTALGLAGFIRIVPSLLHIPDQYDFAAYYVAARVLNAHSTLYNDRLMSDAALIGGTRISFPPYIYPPFLAAILRPIGFLSFESAKAVWFISNLAFLCFSIALLASLIRLSPRATLVVGLVVLMMPPIYDTLLLGQVNILLLLLLTLSVYLSSLSGLNRKGQIGAGVLLGVAATIKIYPIVLGLPYLIGRRLYAVVSMILALIVASILGVILGGGIENTVRFWTNVLPSISGISTFPVNQSIWPVMLRTFSYTQFDFAFMTTSNHIHGSLVPILNAPILGYIFSFLVCAVVGCIMIYSLIFHHFKHNLVYLRLYEFSIGILTIMLTFPVIHDHYLTLLLIPVFFMIGLYLQESQTSIRRLISFTLVLFCLFLVLQRYWRVFLTAIPSPLLLSFGFCATLSLWLAVLYCARRSSIDV